MAQQLPTNLRSRPRWWSRPFQCECAPIWRHRERHWFSVSLRISNALAFIGIHGLDLIWSAFFDDYTVVCDEREENNVTLYVESLFRLLGISFAAEGDKAPPFQTRFRSLGLEFDLENLQHGSFSLHHTAKRKQELLDTIVSLLARKRVSPKELERLHGRLVWFSSFVFGE